MIASQLVDNDKNRQRLRQRADFKSFALGEYVEGDNVEVSAVQELVGMREEDLKPSVTNILDYLNKTEVEEAITHLSSTTSLTTGDPAEKAFVERFPEGKSQYLSPIFSLIDPNSRNIGRNSLPI